jgi:hypothetical protein
LEALESPEEQAEWLGFKFTDDLAEWEAIMSETRELVHRLQKARERFG